MRTISPILGEINIPGQQVVCIILGENIITHCTVLNLKMNRVTPDQFSAGGHELGQALFSPLVVCIPGGYGRKIGDLCQNATRAVTFS